VPVPVPVLNRSVARPDHGRGVLARQHNYAVLDHRRSWATSPLVAGGQAEPDEQVTLAGAPVAEQHDRFAGVEVGAGGQGGELGGLDGTGSPRTGASAHHRAFG
jgi:hypothetical protein